MGQAESGNRIAGKVVVLAVIAATVGGGAWWLSTRDSAQIATFNVAEQVPENARAVVWIDRLDEVTSGLAALSASVRGSEGIQEAARLVLGVKSLDADGLAEKGLVPSAGAVAFAWDDAYWLVMPAYLQDQPHPLKLLAQRGHGIVTTKRSELGSSWAIQDRARKKVIGHAWWQQGTLVARMQAVPLADEVTVALDNLDALSRWKDAKKLHTARLTPNDAIVHALWQIQQDDPVRRVLRRSLGPASLLFGRYVGSFDKARVDASVSAQGVSLKARFEAPKETAADIHRYHQAFITEPAALMDLSDVLPDEVSAVVRARLNPRLISLASGFIALAGGLDLAAIDPVLRGLDAGDLMLEPFDGQVALGLLGVSDDAMPNPAQWRGNRWRKLAGVFLAVTLRDDVAAKKVVDRTRARLAENGGLDETLTLGKWAGVARKDGDWAVVRDRRHLLWIAGAGELARFGRVQSGKFPSLGKVLGHDLERAVVTGKDTWSSSLITTGRIVRSARRRGIPDAITAMISSIEAISSAVTLHEDGMTLQLHVRPQSIPSTGGPK